MRSTRLSARETLELIVDAIDIWLYVKLTEKDHKITGSFPRSRVIEPPEGRSRVPNGGVLASLEDLPTFDGRPDGAIETRDQPVGGRRRLAAVPEVKGYELNSVRNALGILTLLSEVDEVGVSDVARHMGLGMSTAHRLLATLKAQGYVRQTVRTRKYRLGPAMEGLRPTAVYDDYVDVAVGALDWLRNQTSETAHLAVLSQTTLRYLAAAESFETTKVGSREGTTLPAHCTAAGKVLLAALSASTLVRLYPSERLLGPTPRSCRTRTSLEAELALIRRTGYARCAGEAEENVSSLAMVVREANGIPAMSISVSAPSARLDLPNSPMNAGQAGTALLQELSRAVRRIEAALIQRCG